MIGVVSASIIGLEVGEGGWMEMVGDFPSGWIFFSSAGAVPVGLRLKGWME